MLKFCSAYTFPSRVCNIWLTVFEDTEIIPGGHIFPFQFSIVKSLISMKLKTTWLDLTNREFESLEDISKVYGKSLPVPKVSSSTATASYPLNQNECQDYFNLVSKSQQYPKSYHPYHTGHRTEPKLLPLEKLQFFTNWKSQSLTRSRSCEAIKTLWQPPNCMKALDR